MGVIVVPRILQEKLGEEGSDAFVKVIREIDNEARKEALVVAEEHFEVRLSEEMGKLRQEISCLLYTSPSPRDRTRSRMPSSA